MCGICGFNFEDKRAIKRMMAVMSHRGPDQSGYYSEKKISLGHQRLSIIDLSEKGRQPMSNEDGSIKIVYNGEIYNFKELKEELERKKHKFKSETDTEVIVHAYEEYGTGCLSKFNGMFAFAILDSNKKELFLARDRLGIKPLYYYFDDGKFIFASEMKAILQHNVGKVIDKVAVDYYLSYFYVPAPLTIFKGIKKLLPANYLIFKNGKVEVNEYWDAPFLVENKPFGYFKKKMMNLFQESVERRLISDVPLGAFLSGGIDSSAVVAMMSRLKSEVETFAIGFEEESYNELKYAKIVAEHFGTKHHQLICSPDMVKLLPRLVWQLDEPFADHSAVPTFLVSEMARKHVTVALSGDGGDELFAGYPRYLYQKISDYYRKFPVPFPSFIFPRKIGERARRFKEFSKLNETERFLRWSTIFPEKSELYDAPVDNDNKIFKQYLNSKWSPDFYNKMLYADLKLYLPNDILTKVDKMSMLNSLEARVPLLDYKFVESAFSIPFNLKLHGFTKKYFMKRALKDVLPRQILKRKKKGFSIPVNEWFKSDLKNYAYDVLLSNDAKRRGFFNRDYVQKLLEQHARGYRNGNKLWTLLCFELWNRIYMDGDSI